MSKGYGITFNGQLKTLQRFQTQQPAGGKVNLITASRNTFSSTSAKWVPCLTVVMQTRNSSPVFLTSPVGTSSGKNEPSSLTNKGALQVAEKEIFSKYIVPELQHQFIDPLRFDRILEKINRSLPKRPDGIDTPFSRIGGPTATATSLAAVLCLANAAGVAPEIAIYELYNWIAKNEGHPLIKRMSLPIPMSKIVDGGVHGALDNKGRPVTPIQEFLFIPAGYRTWTDALAATIEATNRFHSLMKKQGFEINIGAEAGIVSHQLRSNRQVLQLMSMVIRGFDGLPPLAEMFIGMDVAASELYNEKTGEYFLGADGKRMFGNEYTDFGHMITYYRSLQRDFQSIITIEDPFAEEHYDAWKVSFKRLGDESLVITDDATVTQPHLVEMFVNYGHGGLLTKVNQGGSFARTARAMQIARKNKWATTLSHRSSESAAFFFETLMAIATGAEFLKVTIGGTKGGGGGREARPNAVSTTNVLFETMWPDMNTRHPDWEIYNKFWEGIPEGERIGGLPYQGLILRHTKNPQPWLKRLQGLMKERDEGQASSYDYNWNPWYA